MGQFSRRQYTAGSGDYWQQATPVVYVDLCSDPLQHDTDDNWLHSLLQLGTLYFNKICPLLEPMCGSIPDGHSHHITYEAWLVGILLGAPTGVALHH